MGATSGTLQSTPITIEAWMRESNSPNPLTNLARVNALLASVMAEVLNQQKIVVEEIAAKIKKISELNVLVKSFSNSTDTKPDAKTFLGRTVDESRSLLRQLAEVGVKSAAGSALVFEANYGKYNQPFLVDNTFISNLSLELQTISESEQSRSQQESLRLQTMTNRYTQSNDQASSVIQKDAQSKGTVTNNLRGSGG